MKSGFGLFVLSIFIFLSIIYLIIFKKQKPEEKEEVRKENIKPPTTQYGYGVDSQVLYLKPDYLK